MHLPTRSAGRHRDSAIRNAPLALVALFGMLPPPLGGMAFLASLAVIGGSEAWAVWRDPLGQRRGDLWAQTQVVDAKVVLGATVAERHGAAQARPAGRVTSRSGARRLATPGPRSKQCASR